MERWKQREEGGRANTWRVVRLPGFGLDHVFYPPTLHIFSLSLTHTLSWGSPFIITSVISPIWAHQRQSCKKPLHCQLAHVIIHQQACPSPRDIGQAESVSVSMCACVWDHWRKNWIKQRDRRSAQRCCSCCTLPHPSQLNHIWNPGYLWGNYIDFCALSWP